MPTKSKKDSSSQSATLHQFFTGPSSSPAATQSKPTFRNGKTPLRPKLRTPQNTQRKISSLHVDDIIVISDEDEEMPSCTPSNTQATRPQPDQVLEIEDTPPRRKRAPRERSVSPSTTKRVCAASLQSKAPPITPEQSFTEELQPQHGLSDDDFGMPAILLLPTQSKATPMCTPPPPPPSSTMGPPLLTPESNDLSIDGLWENGDDEIINDLTLDDEAEVESATKAEGTASPNVFLDEEEYLRLVPPDVMEDQKSPKKGQGGCTGSGNAFSVLMSSFKENEAWKEAIVAEDKTFRPTKENGGRRKAPFYKVLQGMPIAVDAFRYGAIPGVKAYFLTHAHSDHYTNLSSNWKNGPIYCSEATANLIIHMLSVDKKWVHPLPMDIPTEIPDTGGVKVTLMDANHCPGSSLFFFEGQQTTNAGDSSFKSPFIGSTRIFRYLHCGDFRANPQHVLHPAVKGKKIDTVYLDTTYLDPKYCFPPQPLVISACADLVTKLVAGETINTPGSSSVDTFFPSMKQEADAKPSKRNPVIVVGTYSIGKERIVKAIAHALNSKVYCDARKAAILRCQSDPELNALLSSDPLASRVHLVPLGVVSSDRLKGYVDRWKGHYTHVIAFRPTGWTYTPAAGTDSLPTLASVIAKAKAKSWTAKDMRPMRNSTRDMQLYGVPYSEHSSFAELTCFALSFDWGRMIATVNVGSENSRKKMGRWMEKWEAERKAGDGKVVPYRRADYW